MAEQVLWKGKPFNYGFPSFTTYTITSNRLIVERGIFTKTRKEIRLYRIRDGSSKRNLWERLWSMGDIVVNSTDVDTPNFLLRNIKGAVEVADILLNAADEARRTNRAYEMTEVVEQHL
ncbi:PH domain-containing protein [Cohnella nanjingensis]|uniref:PH domain-containing protein n=1 Tax=Cohnella nanjingensis TaxID=1387779 RepID=A0A7X0RSQ2_9BACL|nr:PH domain-containing protein [Cohnella nanjingensis]MBB6672808.1 PH domain-containing protein [Cohnella nanjingensis]